MSFILNLLFVAGFAHAQQSPATCPDIVERHDGTQIQQLWSPASEACFFSVVPQDAYVDLTYRDYLFTSHGLLMVFNSFGPGDESQNTAAREFMLFPRVSQQFTYKWNDDVRELEFVHVTGDKFIFDAKKGRLKSMDRAKVTVADYVEPSNRGGVEILNYPGLLLDSGFRIGNAPTSDASASSVFRDSKGATCKVKNSEIYKYTGGGDVIFKYSDKGLKTFLQSRCPKLVFP